MAAVSRDEFKIRSELEAVHIPTGAAFRVYPYSDPDDVLQSLKADWSRAPAECTGDYAEQVLRMASQLLLERTLRAASDRRKEMAA